MFNVFVLCNDVLPFFFIICVLLLCTVPPSYTCDCVAENKGSCKLHVIVLRENETKQKNDYSSLKKRKKNKTYSEIVTHTLTCISSVGWATLERRVIRRRCQTEKNAVHWKRKFRLVWTLKWALNQALRGAKKRRSEEEEARPSWVSKCSQVTRLCRS